MKTKLIAANWKMNKTLKEAEDFSRKIKKAKSKNQILIFPPSPYLSQVSGILKGTKIEVGAQNIHQKLSGAFTGEISAEMAKSCGAKWALIGHSERRTLFGETNKIANEKIKIALASSLKVMLCVGESIDQREQDKTFEVLKNQLLEGLEGIRKEQLGDIAIAYEPVWAIGTGKNATPSEAQKAHAFIRKTLRERFGEKAKSIKILYGGSVNEANSKDLLSQKDIDGALVGGASLDLKKFLQIANA